MTYRKFADVFFKHLVRVAALTSVLALGAILLFVFAQGTMPFFAPTAKGVRLVPQRIASLTVNGTEYANPATFIELPRGTETIVITADGETLELAYNADKKTPPDKRLSIIRNERGEVSSPEYAVFTVSWKGTLAALDKKLHVILPEPPYGIGKFLAGMDWSPAREKVFGIFPMIAGTLLTSLGAILLGVPLAMFSALFMAEFLGEKPAAAMRSGIELLAGIPSVVYGFFGLMVVVPAVKKIFAVPSGNTMLSASLVLALMILPTVITIAETSLRAVPLSVREASLALGASKMQTAWHVVLPHASSGVAAGIILGISRAVGETMAVILVAGNSPQLTANPLASVRTLTATIAMEMGYASGRHGEMLFSIGVVLFALILILNAALLSARKKMEAGA